MFFKALKRLATLAGIGLFGAAIVKELRRPPEARQWRGHVAGVPYDLRPPTWARVKNNVWNPSDPEIIKDKSFGVGWDVNFGAVARKAGLASKASD